MYITIGEPYIDKTINKEPNHKIYKTRFYDPFKNFLPTKEYSSKIEVNLAGTKKKDISIEIVEDSLYVKVKEKTREHFYIDSNKDRSKITAKYDNGMLTINLPNKEKEIISIKIE